MAANGTEKRSGTLDGEIHDLEQRLRWRRVAARLHAADVGHGLRRKLTSPATLIAAVGVGFAAGWYQMHRKAGPRAEPPVPREARKAPGPSIFATIMDGLSLAGTLLAMLPRHDRAPATAPDGTGAVDPR